MNLLLANGHRDAWHYPLGMLYDEADLVVERENGRIITEAQTLQLAMASVLSKKGASAFTARLKDLNVISRPIPGLFDDH